MPIDVVTLNAVANELNNLLLNGRIEKVYQPEQDEVSLFIKANGKYHQLVISANPTHPRMHISSQKKENAMNAPAFCMLLRKHLIGAIIKGTAIFNDDRIIKMTLECKNELKDSKQMFLIVELMGRYSNIILTTEDMIIVDAIKRIHFDQSTTRYILPTLSYTFQPQTRLTWKEEDKLKLYFENNPDDDASSLLKSIGGIGKESSQEICSSTNRYEKLQELFHITTRTSYQPSLLLKNGQIVDFFVYPYSSINGEWQPCTTLNEALDRYYIQHDTLDRKNISSKTVTTILKRLIAKNDRRIEENNQKISEWEKAEEIRRKGEFITNYIYLIKNGDTTLICSDYYENKDISIDLNPCLSPAQNAQQYYKKYNKLKRAKDLAIEQNFDLTQKKEYLKTLEVSIRNCSLKTEFDEILSELNILGGYIKKGSKKDKIKLSQPIHKVINGLDVYWGKNNQQNAQVTFDIASSCDTWLHAKHHHGAHVIIKGTPDDSTLKKCAEIAAFYSDAKQGSKVEVDYTLRKFVKKIPSAPVGLVTYTDYKTILCEPKDF